MQSRIAPPHVKIPPALVLTLPAGNLPALSLLAASGQDEDTAFDLFSISNINRKTIGAKQFRGPDPSVPAYRFVRFDYIPPVNADYLSKIAKTVRQKEGFFLTASLKQDPKSRGTLLALEGPGASQRQFEIVSNGPADTLDLTYWIDGTQHVISLEDVGLADSQWKNVTVQVTGDTYSLYVGCDLIDSFTLDEPFYEQLRTEKSRMYVAKGSARESHFRVRMAGSRPTREAGEWELGADQQRPLLTGCRCWSRSGPARETHTTLCSAQRHAHTSITRAYAHACTHVHTRTHIHTLYACTCVHTTAHIPMHTRTCSHTCLNHR